jgi:hypothetical protein
MLDQEWEMSYFITEAIGPFLLDQTRSHQLLLAFAINRGADAMASRSSYAG